MHIFISYAKKDTYDLARRLREALAALPGVTAWMDEYIDGGEEWSRKIKREIDRSDWMVVLISPDVNRDTFPPSFVLNEIQYALMKRKPIVPVLAQVVEMPIELLVYQYVDLSESPDNDTAQVVDAVCKRAGISAPFLSESPSERWSVQDLLPPPFEWCNIPAGQVALRDGIKKSGSKGVPNFVEAFALAKYPITNAQYKVFVNATDGYENLIWWNFSPEARDWRATNPEQMGTAYEGDDLPRTNVSWYDAVAFCSWLNHKTGLPITLPTEHQWQRAAQGNDSREYPWGNQFDPTCCNYGKKVGQPTPVTAYPSGASPYGVMDMCGNVWEWCLTDLQTGRDSLVGYTQRVLRGGAWISYLDRARALYRPGYNPSRRSGALGFRIVCAQPIFVEGF
jgi:formylglycine-generating enzyme required for sulfatase activity